MQKKKPKTFHNNFSSVVSLVYSSWLCKSLNLSTNQRVSILHYPWGINVTQWIMSGSCHQVKAASAHFKFGLSSLRCWVGFLPIQPPHFSSPCKALLWALDHSSVFTSSTTYPPVSPAFPTHLQVKGGTFCELPTPNTVFFLWGHRLGSSLAQQGSHVSGSWTLSLSSTTLW